MRIAVLLGLAAGGLLPASGRAADWTPSAWADLSTLELRTTAVGEAAHWSPLWLVVVDDQLYVRLGSRAAGRVDGNTTTPIVGVRIAGRQFDRVRGEPAPEMAGHVAGAMAGKYWFDLLVRHVDHPLTLRLLAE